MITHFQRRKVLRLFNLLDLTGDGVVEYQDFVEHARAVRREAGWDEEDPRYLRLLASRRKVWSEFQGRVDENSDGVITLEEWLAFFSTVEARSTEGQTPPWTAEIRRQLYSSIDLDRDGQITREEYRFFTRAVGIQSDPDALFDSIDREGEDFLSEADFDRLFDEWLLGKEPKRPGSYFLVGWFDDTPEEAKARREPRAAGGQAAKARQPESGNGASGEG
ncbi:MAG: hypothetical protein HY319_22940 [Armatimonadetes bacterium]|nr:hypothetical protein [Armatimonadota bacterium]